MPIGEGPESLSDNAIFFNFLVFCKLLVIVRFNSFKYLKCSVAISDEGLNTSSMSKVFSVINLAAILNHI